MFTRTGTHPITHDIAAHYLRSLVDRSNGTAIPVASGFDTLDKALPGWLEDGRLITVASRPGVDRLHFIQAITEHIAAQQRTVLWFALSTNKDEFIEHSIAHRAGVTVAEFRGGAAGLEKAKRIRVLDAINAFSRLPILVDDTYQDVGAIIAKTRHLHRCAATDPRLALDCVVVDSLQLLPQAEEHLVKHLPAALQLRMLAREIGVPVIALSGLNAAGQGDEKRAPTLGDLPPDQYIDEYSNIVLLLHRDAEIAGYGATEAIIAENSCIRPGAALL